MFRLAHISDIHLGPLPRPTLSQLASKRLLGYLNWRRSRRHAYSLKIFNSLIADLQDKKPDHLAITGDLVNLGLPDEFINAARFLNTLGNPQNMTVICGNHDAYVPGALEHAIHHWQPWMTGGAQEPVTQSDYPLLRRIGDIAIISCNSAEATWPFMATGYFRQQQAHRLSRILAETGRQNLCRIITIHHPPVRNSTAMHKRLIGTSLFHKAVRDGGAELVLHGHTHLATRNTIMGNTASVPVICVPAASNRFGGKRPAARYNLFDISRQNQSWAIHMEEHGIRDDTGRIALIDKHKLR